MGATCVCEENVCAWEKNFAEWECIDNEKEQALPLWGGGVFNYVKDVQEKYIVLKARVTNAVPVEAGRAKDKWEHARVDLEKRPELKDPDFWATSPFTMFVFCPFDITMGGFEEGKSQGRMTFPDFYPSECSPDGLMCSFLSRSNTFAVRDYASQTDAKKIEQFKISAYFKGFIDRSSDDKNQGPYDIKMREGNEDVTDQYTCETGILDGHHPNAIHNMKTYFHVFKDGDFKQMVNYMRTNNLTPELDNNNELVAPEPKNKL